MVRVVKRDPKENSSDVINFARSNLSVNISKWTARRILNRAKLFAHRPATKPLLNQRHRTARLAFAKEHQHWNVNDCARVLWSDECKFNLHNPDGACWIRRQTGERYNSKFVKTSLKFGGGSIMAWG